MHRIGLLTLFVFYLDVQISSLKVLNYKEGDELVGVVVCYRHGDRSPSASFPDDPYIDLKYWPDGLGQLLDKGKAHQFQLGQWLRSRYDGFLSQRYVPQEILVRSTDVDRTLQSAASNLAGLYYLSDQSDSNIWPVTLPWNPVPIHTVPEKDDRELAMETNCKNYNKLLNDTIYSNTFKGMIKEHDNITKFIESKTGWKINKLKFFEKLHSIFYIYLSHNVSYLPDWYNDINSEELQHLAGVSYSIKTYNFKLQRYKVGPFFNYLNNYFDGIFSATNKKFLMLSGHHGTIVSILNSYGSYNNYPPEFCSMIIWELYKTSEGNKYLKIFYKRHTEGDYLEEVRVRNCATSCDYNKYKKALENITTDLKTWKRECNENV